MISVALLLIAATAFAGDLHGETRLQPRVVKWVDFNGGELPRNGAGDTYPSQYEGEGGRAKVSLDDADAVSGHSIRFEVTQKTFYAHFNAFSADGTRGFARQYVAHPDRWQFNTYNRLSFWFKCPRNAFPLLETGQGNLQVGTYVKRVKDADRYSDESGGDHGYHHFNIAPTGTWTKLVMNMHPSHFRGQSGAKEHGNQPHPTKEPAYNYFDTLTRLYVDASRGSRLAGMTRSRHGACFLAVLRIAGTGPLTSPTLPVPVGPSGGKQRAKRSDFPGRGQPAAPIGRKSRNPAAQRSMITVEEGFDDARWSTQTTVIRQFSEASLVRPPPGRAFCTPIRLTTEVTRDTFEVDDMADRSSLLEIIASRRPGLTISAYTEGDSLVVCLRGVRSETRIALLHQPSITDVDAILGAVANRLVCCRHCDGDSDPICRQDHRIMSNRLERFLHPDIYEIFLANAPLAMGTGRLSRSPDLSLTSPSCSQPPPFRSRPKCAAVTG